MTEPLAKALSQDDDILILSHSLGTVIAYDVLWKFSYCGEWQDIRNKKVSMLVTLGSPLGDEAVKCWQPAKVGHFCFVKERSRGCGSIVGLPALPVVALTPS